VLSQKLESSICVADISVQGKWLGVQTYRLQALHRRTYAGIIAHDQDSW
jgi:hypothetical protein